MKTITVAPAAGRTVRFPAGHALEGEPIPAEGAEVSAAHPFVKRYMLTGDLVVRPSAVKPRLNTRNPDVKHTAVETMGGSSSSSTSMEGESDALDFDPAELRGWTIKRLLEVAERAGVVLPPKASKQDIIDAITGAAAPLEEG